MRGAEASREGGEATGLYGEVLRSRRPMLAVRSEIGPYRRLTPQLRPPLAILGKIFAGKQNFDRLVTSNAQTNPA
jgi:hypothetical protein